MSFELHDVEWTPEKIARFWSAMSACDWARNSHFSQQVGRELIHFVRRKTPLQGPIMDYGAGIGFLIRYLLTYTDADIYACEYAPVSAATIQREFAENPRFRGCAVIGDGGVAIAAGTFGMVFLVEAIEHMPPPAREVALGEIYRLLRRDGKVVVTTPNDEQLDAAKTICPDCGAMFHRMQHVAKYDPATLRQVMEKHGFATLYCGGLQLEHYAPGLGLKGVYWRWRDRRRQTLPHLVYIGTKNSPGM